MRDFISLIFKSTCTLRQVLSQCDRGVAARNSTAGQLDHVPLPWSRCWRNRLRLQGRRAHPSLDEAVDSRSCETGALLTPLVCGRPCCPDHAFEGIRCAVLSVSRVRRKSASHGMGPSASVRRPMQQRAGDAARRQTLSTVCRPATRQRAGCQMLAADPRPPVTFSGSSDAATSTTRELLSFRMTAAIPKPSTEIALLSDF